MQKASQSASAQPIAVYNPNLYVANNYIGGTGARDRLDKLVSEGVMVDGKRVRLEAFSRNYAQAFPIPSRTALGVTAATEHGKIVQEGSRTYLQIGLQAMKGEAPRRPPLNIALVMDRSGSMQQENKLVFAKQAATALVASLAPSDTLALVAFDDRAEVLAPAQRVGDGRGIKGQIAALVPGSGTNIYDGLQLGYAEARKNGSPDRSSIVILLSDGEVTSGISDPAEFQRLATESVDRDIQTTTIGMGVEFNEDLMLSVAREGRGNYHFIRGGEDARRVLAKELDELTHVVAKAVKLRIRLADGVGLVRVLGAPQLNAAETRQVRADEKKIDRKVYEELGISPDRQRAPEEPGIKMLIPNFYRGDNHVVMLEIAVPPGHGKRPVAEVFLKFKDLVAGANRELRAPVAVEYTPHRLEMIASTNRGVKKNLLGFQTGEALIEAAALIEADRLAEAIRKIDDRMVVLGVAAQEWRDQDLDRDGKLLDRYKTVVAQLRRDPTMAGGNFGEYLKKSLSYSGYTMTR